MYPIDQNFLSARAELKSSEAAYNPTLNASANLYRNFNKAELSAPGAVGTSYFTSYSQQIWPSLNLQQTFLTPFGSKVTLGAGMQTGISGLSSFSYQTTPQLTLSYQQPLSASGIESGHADIVSAKRSYLNSQMGYQLQKEQFILLVVQSYFQLWQSVRSVDQSERDFESTKRVLEIAELKLKSGSISEFEVINLRVQNRFSEDNLLQARNNLETQGISFYRLIGDTADMWHPGIVVQLDSYIPLDSMTISLDSAVSIALNRRIELKQGEIAIEQSRLTREQTASTLSPTLQLQANYNFSSQYEPTFINSLTLLPNYGWGLQASISIPLWDGGRTSANIEAADRNLSIQKKNLSLLKESVVIDIENRYRTLELDLGRLNSLGLNLEAAKEALEIAELRFQSGQISSTEIEDIRNRYNTAENTLNQAKISCVLERAGLAEAMGELSQWIETLKRGK
ncbi:MAG: TolC family protein [Bacteroidetes bacterium]|nr:TolC family protein [Bacteroidota bacterium]